MMTVVLLALLTFAGAIVCNKARFRNDFFSGLICGAFSLGFLLWGLSTHSSLVAAFALVPALAAALYFPPLVAIVAGIVSSSGNIVLFFAWKDYLISDLMASVSLLIVVLFALACSKWVFRGKTPSVVAAGVFSIAFNLIYFGYEYLFTGGNFGVYFKEAIVVWVWYFVASTSVLMALSFFFRRKQTLKENLYDPKVIAAFLFLLCIYVFSLFQYSVAKERSLDTIESANKVINSNLDDAISVMLHYIGTCIVRDVGTCRDVDLEEICEIAQGYSVDELNIIDTNGLIVSSTDTSIGMRQSNIRDGKGTSSIFMQLMNGDEQFLSQKFRRGVHNPNVICKYVGVPFEDKSGIVQLGYNIERLIVDYPLFFSPQLKNWEIGITGYYLVINTENNKVLATSKNNEYFSGKSCADLGLEPSAETIQSVNIAGKYAFVKYVDLFPSWRFVAVLPYEEFYSQATQAICVMGTILFFIFIFFGWSFISISIAQQKINKLRADEDERRAQDLATARSIQMAAIPCASPAFPRDFTLDLYASILPAREVGGDFYDFYYLSQNRVAFLIADVSGKGIPAAMFMMSAKNTLKSCAAECDDIAEAMVKANAILSENNEAGMFVTCFFAVLNTTTGDVEYVNAGHNPPYVRDVVGNVRELAGVSGLFLAGMSDTVYTKFHTRLNVGDTVFLFTDGITEANNLAQEMFGEERLVEALHGGRICDKNRRCNCVAVRPRDLCGNVQRACEAFVGKAPQFDDITMLAVTYRGEPQKFMLMLPVKMESITEFSNFVEENLRRVGCTDDVRNNLLVAVDEIATNIISYSGSKEMSVNFVYVNNPPTISLVFIDSGVPYDPLQHKDPNLDEVLDHRAIGGLGIYMVKKLMDEVYYEYKGNQNILTLRKELPIKDILDVATSIPQL